MRTFLREIPKGQTPIRSKVNTPTLFHAPLETAASEEKRAKEMEKK
jgi:hypothetical protein